MQEKLKALLAVIPEKLSDEVTVIRGQIQRLHDSLTPEQHQEVRRTVTHLLEIAPVGPWKPAALAIWTGVDTVATAVENQKLPQGVTMTPDAPAVPTDVVDLHKDF